MVKNDGFVFSMVVVGSLLFMIIGIMSWGENLFK